MEMMLTDEVLRRKGFTQAEIDRLNAFRRILWDRQTKQSTTTRRRLEFIRWLVMTGRLAD